MRTQEDGLKTKCHSRVVLMSVLVPRPWRPWVTCALGYSGSDLRPGLSSPKSCCLTWPRLTKAHMTSRLISRRTAPPLPSSALLSCSDFAPWLPAGAITPGTNQENLSWVKRPDYASRREPGTSCPSWHPGAEPWSPSLELPIVTLEGATDSCCLFNRLVLELP